MGLRDIVGGTLIVLGGLTFVKGIYSVVNIDYDIYPLLKSEKEISLRLEKLTTDGPSSSDYNLKDTTKLKDSIENLKENIEYVGEEELRRKEKDKDMLTSIAGLVVLLYSGFFTMSSKKPKKKIS